MGTVKKNYFIPVVMLAAAYNAIYSLAFMKGLYYSLMQHGFHLTHFRLGQLYSVQGIFAMAAYLCGAYFLKYFSQWKLVAGASCIVGVLTTVLILLPPYPVMLAVFGVIGFLVGAAFYPAHLEILHHLGGSTEQGKVFSLFFLFNCIFGVLFAAIGFCFSNLPFSDEMRVRVLLGFFALLNLAGSLLAVIILRKIDMRAGDRAPLSFGKVRELMKNRKLWYVILIVFVNYISYTNLNYTIPYLRDVLHLSGNTLNILAIVRVYLIGIVAAPLAGKITDRTHRASRLMGLSFMLYGLTIVLTVAFGATSAPLAVCFILLLCLFSNMGKSMALITVDEAQIPYGMYGMAISLISFLAYSPDAFYYSVSGQVIDSFGNLGYAYIFTAAAVCSLIGLAAVRRLQREEGLRGDRSIAAKLSDILRGVSARRRSRPLS